MGYIDGKIPKPVQSSTSDKDTPTTGTPIYSTTPTLDEWNFRDQLTRGHITLNCTDVASLGVITTGTAKDAWDSIENEWGKSTDMRRSHAQEALNRTEYTEGTEIQDYIKLLRTRKAAVDNLSTSTMSDETWRGIIIRSIPPTPKWLPVIPSLYSMTTSADIISTLLAHGMIIGRETKMTTSTSTTNSSTTALAAHTNEGCKNPNCKAKDRSTHTTENCYWPGGGKEGQFPANFGQRSKANITVSSPSQVTEHFALSARALETPGRSGVLIDEPDVSSVGEQIPTPLETDVLFKDDSTGAITDCTQAQDTYTTTITDTPINNQPASANQPDTNDITVVHHNPDGPDHWHHQDITIIPIKPQRSKQILQLGPNSTITEYTDSDTSSTNPLAATPDNSHYNPSHWYLNKGHLHRSDDRTSALTVVAILQVWRDKYSKYISTYHLKIVPYPPKPILPIMTLILPSTT
jgi:hypothetical protein